MNVDGKGETHYTKIKFEPTWIMQMNRQPNWLKNWWTYYGINKTTLDPVYYESYTQKLCNWCNERNIECFHPTHKNIEEFLMPTMRGDDDILHRYMTHHYEWLVMTKIKHQIVLNKPMVVRRIYTKAWDEHVYKRLRFPGISILEERN